MLIAAIAIVGALITGYLTMVKFSGGSAACPTEGCSIVLSSPYANFFGLPLSLFGLLAYISMAVFALSPLAISSEDQKDLRSNLEKWTWLLLFAGATAMTIFSGYLVYLLAFKINALCIYCIASAICSVSLLVLTVIGNDWEDIGQLFFTGIIVGMIALIGTGVIHASNSPQPTASPSLSPVGDPTRGTGWEITNVSGEAEIALARHLTKIGVTMYSAWWCPHCHEQKQLFGKEAFKEVTSIECAPDGKNSQTNLCVKTDIKSYPSWQINGRVEAGVKSLEELADLSGYQGDRNFKFQFPQR